MAISRQDLLKELLPGLNALFDVAYHGDPTSWFKEKKVFGVHDRELREVPLPSLHDLWLARFGETVSVETLRDSNIFEKDSYMDAVGTELNKWGYLTYDIATEIFTLHDKPTYANPRQQSSSI
jgi:hypothetical protein